MIPPRVSFGGFSRTRRRRPGAAGPWPARGPHDLVGGYTMNSVGKILVFVNLLFALIVGGFLAIDFSTRTNWREYAKELERELEVSRTNTTTLHGTSSKLMAELKGALDN